MWSNRELFEVYFEIPIVVFGVAFELFMTVRYGPLDYWWILGATTAGTAVLGMAADRSRHGRWAVYIAGAVLAIAVLAGTQPLIAGWRAFALGIWLGLGLNRVVFGLLRPMPEFCRRKRIDRADAAGPA